MAIAEEQTWQGQATRGKATQRKAGIDFTTSFFGLGMAGPCLARQGAATQGRVLF